MTVFFDTGHAGTWAEALLFRQPFLRVEPYEPQQCVFDPLEGSADTDARALTPVSLSLHAAPCAPKGQHDHER